MLVYRDRAIYNFNLTTKEEALILSQFVDSENELLFPYFECNFSSFPKDKAFVEERVKIKSRENIFKIQHSSLNDELVYWYKPHDLDDLINIIDRDRISYRCIVIPKNGALKNFRFKLFVYEHATYEAEETRALWIDEGAENDFVNFVYPRILKSFPILLV